MRIASGVTDQYCYFVAVDPSTYSRLTGLSSFTVYRSRNGGTPAAMSTPTIAEVDSANMPGVYTLLMDEDMGIDGGDDTQEMLFHITHAGMDPVSRTIELYRPKVTLGQTLTVASGVASANAVQVSGDATAADNLEAQYDGTGLSGATYPATQASIDAIGAASGGSLNFEANEDNTAGAIVGGVTFVGSQTNTFAATQAEDGTYHVLTHSANNIDVVYGFAVGGARLGVEVTFRGYLDGSNDVAFMQVYDHVGTDWETIATINGQAGSDNIVRVASLLTKHTGSGAELGNVYIRLIATAQSSPILRVDQLLVSAVSLAQSVGYQEGAVWVDTNDGTAGTESYVNGTADNPVASWADALTIANAIGLKRFVLIAGSSITLSANSDNYDISGQGATVALNGQSVSGAHIVGAIITGNDSGSNVVKTRYEDCEMGNNTLGLHRCISCGLTGEIALAELGTYEYIDCYSEVAGTGSPSINFGDAVGGTNLNMRRYSGGISVKEMGSASTGTDFMSLEGDGQLIVDSTCEDGEIAVRGNFRLRDESNGAVELNPTIPNIDQLHSGRAQSGTANTIILEASSASSVDGFYDPGKIILIAGTGAGQSRSITDYNGTTKVASVQKDWRVAPDSTTSYVILAESGELHTNEGLAQGGAASTITLNAAASATDDIYIGQTVYLSSGTGQDQARIVTDYDGTTKVATVHRAWDVQPDSATGYLMLPLPGIGDTINNIPTAIQNADALLNRDMSAVADSNSRTPLNAFRALRNRVGVIAGVATVYKENDTTAAWTAAVTGDSDGFIITESDPT